MDFLRKTSNGRSNNKQKMAHSTSVEKHQLKMFPNLKHFTSSKWDENGQIPTKL